MREAKPFEKDFPLQGARECRGRGSGAAERELALGETSTPAFGKGEVVGKADSEFRGREAGRFKDRKTEANPRGVPGK